VSTKTPYTIRIIVADGDPDGLKIVERGNWNGKALMFPRTLYSQIRNREEFKSPGVYLLIGKDINEDVDTLYIGEGDPVGPRLEQHNHTIDFWTKAVFFVSSTRKLNKAHVQYLEAQLIKIARAANRIPLKNRNNPSEPTLDEAEYADIGIFLHHLLELLPVLGIQAFDQIPNQPPNGTDQLLTCKGRGVSAKGYDTTQGFIVQTGSYAAGDEIPLLQTRYPHVSKLRANLLENGILLLEGNKMRFTKNYPFNSPSLASAVILGRSSNGRTDWKDKNGRTLKQIQEEQENPTS